MEEPTPISPFAAVISPFTSVIEMFMTFLIRLDSVRNPNPNPNPDETIEANETLRADMFSPAQLPHYLPEIDRHQAEMIAISNGMWLIRKARVALNTIMRYTSRETEMMVSEEVGDETYVITYPVISHSEKRCMNILIIMKAGYWYVCGKSRNQDCYVSQRSYDCLFDLLRDIMTEIKITSVIRISNTDIFTRSFDGYRDIETLNNVITLRESLPDSNADTRLYDSFTKYLYLVRNNIDDIAGPIARMKHSLEKLLSENLRLETLPQYFGFVPNLHRENIFGEKNNHPFEWFISKSSSSDIYLLYMMHVSGSQMVQIMYRDGAYKYLKDDVMSKKVRWETCKSFFHCLMSALMSGSGVNFDFTKCDVFSNDFKRYWEYRYAENQSVMTSLLRNYDSISSALDTVDLTEVENPPVQNTLPDLFRNLDINQVDINQVDTDPSEPVEGPGN